MRTPDVKGREAATVGAVAWHGVTAEAAAAELGVELDGLSPAEVRERLARLGPNRLDPPPPPSGLKIFVHQFKSPLIYVLLVAGALALALAEYADAAFIAFVLLLNAVIGYFQEMKAERGIQALASLVHTRARVRRGGHVVEVDGEELVPGDLLLLDSGGRVPADVRLVEANGLRVDESLLTGESDAVHKDARGPVGAEVPLAERVNMAFAGSMVVSGRARGLVVATAMRTEVGAIAHELAGAARQPPPLVVRMERFARRVGLIVVGLAFALVALGLVRGDDLGVVILGAVALAVSAIPEGLPVAMTVALSVGVRRMVARRVVVRHLPAVEGLGSCNVIATDKTGTLTCNELTVEAVVAAGERFAVEGAGYVPEGAVRREGGADPASGAAVAIGAAEAAGLARLVRAGCLTNEGDLAPSEEGGWDHSGDPTDVALLVLAGKLGFDAAAALAAAPRTREIPFEAERRYSASVHDIAADAAYGAGRVLVCVKGAPERVLAMCDRALVASGDEGALDLAAAEARVEGLMAEGYRVLALADGTTVPEEGEEPAGMVFLGVVALTDPPRPKVAEAIAACHDAGIRVVMITGDHAKTATAIGERIGLSRPGDRTISGAEIEALDDDALAAAVADCAVVARATPKDKLRVVRALQANGAFVAVTGDGVNDAPALRQANLGVAMGRTGTDVAREAADLVITDDDFSSIVGGVEEGRVAYDNVRKATYLLISTGAAEVLLVMTAILVGLDAPFTAAQLLWLNLVTNGIQDVALVFEPGEAGVLARPPRRPGEGVLNPLMITRTLLAAAVMAGIGLLLWWEWSTHGIPTEQARGMMVHLFVLFEILHIGNARSETIPLLRMSPLKNPILMGGTALALAIHVGATYFPPTQSLLGVAPLDAAQWLTLLAYAVPIVVVMEAHKFWRRARTRRAA